jgi:hypothetical protein
MNSVFEDSSYDPEWLNGADTVMEARYPDAACHGIV